MKFRRKMCRMFRKSFSLVLAFTMMLSVCAVSGVSLSAFAATSQGQQIFINLNNNSNWSKTTALRYRYYSSDGVKSSGTVYKSGTNFKTVAPSGATTLEISSGSCVIPYQNLTPVAAGKQRIFLSNGQSGKEKFKEPYAYVWKNGTSDENAVWPGQAMTKIGTSVGNVYYYIDVDASLEKVIFSSKGSDKTADLTIGKNFSKNISLYNSSNQWDNPYIITLDLSDVSGNKEFYLNSDAVFEKSKYISSEPANAQSNATYKTVYVYNENWKSLSKIYATYDYTDNYKGTIELAKTTVNNYTVFSGKIPVDANLRFHPQSATTAGASSITYYPNSSGYDGSNFNSNTATYKITTKGEGWAKFSDINSINYDSIVDNTFSGNIIGVDATYIDYWSNVERNETSYLVCKGNENMDNYWYQFDDFNRYISDIAAQHSSAWKYPLYFGNLFKGDTHYNEFKSHVNGLTNFGSDKYDNNYYYAINNSNGMYWYNGSKNESDYKKSIQGLVYNRLDSDGDLQVANGVKAPYFDAQALATANYNNKRVAYVYKSSFPFRKSTNGDVTEYEFTSKNAADNIYFAWDGKVPKYINYGAGTAYGVNDDLSSFSGSANGYGIFPFNSNSNTNEVTIDGKTYKRTGNDRLDYGFGIRLDIDFKVPKDGILPDGTPVSFNFTGDDDLWAYIGEDPTGADAELVLDLGGDHKEASGSINFNTMKAVIGDSFANFGSDRYSKEDILLSVPSDEFWVKTDSSYADFCLNVWQDTSVAKLNDGSYFIQPYETSDGYYKFKKSQLGNNTSVNFEKYMNTSGYLCNKSDVNSLYGNVWYGSGAQSANPSFSATTKTFNGGKKLDPNKTYHMVVFYMERGEAESNFSVNFTMTPANNDLKVDKTLDTGDVISDIAADLKKNETFDYTIDDGSGNTTGKSYKLTKGGETSNKTLENNGFVLQDSDLADFDNSFKTGSSIAVNESTNNSSLAYTTSWNLVNSKDGSLINKGSSTGSSFNLVDPTDESAYAQLQLDYTNKLVTAPIEISKDVVDEDGTSDYDTDQQFTFAVALDFDGSGSKYDYKTYPLEYQLKEKGASSYSSTVYRTSSDGSFTIKKGESIKLLNIPVGTTYKLTEKAVTGYIPYKVGNESFSGTYESILGTSGAVLDFVNKHNPVDSSIPIYKTLNGQPYSGAEFEYTIRGLAAMDTGKVDGDGNKIMSISTVGVNQTKSQPDSNGKVEFDDISYTSAGTYRFVITESLVSTANAEDFKMDKNSYLVQVELAEGGILSKPQYIKVNSADIKGKTDAELAAYFNSTTANPQDSATFENYLNPGSVTVKKKGQNDETIANTVFALVKVSAKDILTDDDINTIVKKYNNSDYIIKATTDSNGSAKFSNLKIFQTGYQFRKNGDKLVYDNNGSSYMTGDAVEQVYCLFEFSPSEGYNPTNVKQYFSLPQVKDGKRYYDVTFDYVDGPITMPAASGPGMNMYIVLGAGIAGLAMTAFVGYAAYDRVSRKKRRARYRRK